MTPRVTCPICRATWYADQTPKCSHAVEEWAQFSRQQFTHEDEPINRAQKRKPNPER